MKTAVVLAVLVCLAAGCGQPTEAPPAATAVPSGPRDVFGTGTISGRAIFPGEPPKPVVIQMQADDYCKAAHGGTVTSQDVLRNGDGTLRNVFVYVKQGLAGPYTPPPTPAVIDQDACLYRPRVLGVQVGQPLLIHNSDDTLHNIHALCEVNEPFNIGQAVRGMESKKVFTQPEVMVHFKCDVHIWMSGYIGVIAHPFYAVTGDGGTFTLSKLPPGDYIIEAWHEKFGRRQQSVSLGRDEAKTIDFTFANVP